MMKEVKTKESRAKGTKKKTLRKETRYLKKKLNELSERQETDFKDDITRM